jgi:hypothetical protein
MIAAAFTLHASASKGNHPEDICAVFARAPPPTFTDRPATWDQHNKMLQTLLADQSAGRG